MIGFLNVYDLNRTCFVRVLSPVFTNLDRYFNGANATREVGEELAAAYTEGGEELGA